MEFRIVVTEPNDMVGDGPPLTPTSRYVNPSELTPTEKVELIKQLCPEIDEIADNWETQVLDDEKFTDYLVEHMEVKE